MWLCKGREKEPKECVVDSCKVAVKEKEPRWKGMLGEKKENHKNVHI